MNNPDFKEDVLWQIANQLNYVKIEIGDRRPIPRDEVYSMAKQFYAACPGVSTSAVRSFFAGLDKSDELPLPSDLRAFVAPKNSSAPHHPV